MNKKYRKNPVEVEAVQWTGDNHAEICDFIDPECFEIRAKEGLMINTLEGTHHASIGDYIIRGVKGEFYPCKPDIFEQTYTPVTYKPLTLDELREMDGEPVWVTFSDGSGGHWAIIHRDFLGVHADDGETSCWFEYPQNCIAYRHKPKEATT